MHCLSEPHQVILLYNKVRLLTLEVMQDTEAEQRVKETLIHLQYLQMKR